MDFAPVAGWYGGKTGALTRVHVEVMADTAAQVAQYESGVFSLIGFGRQPLAPAAATRYTSDAKLKDQLSLVPAGTTFWIGFNLKSGPFAAVEGGRAGRRAFNEAIDRQALAGAVCNQKTTCVAATGGVVSKGLQGYLGDGADYNVKFDAATAKTEYQAWDPDGSKVKGLTYTYDTNAFNQAVCENLAAQWKKNLAVTVGCVEVDRRTFFDQRNGACAYPMFRQSWAADYDHPQDWFDYLFVTGASSSGSCYSNPNLDKEVSSADAALVTSGTAGYRVAGFMLVNDSIFGGLLYGVQQYLVHPYVKGAGGNALYDNDWTEVRILRSALFVGVGARVVHECDGDAGDVVEADVGVLMPDGQRSSDLRPRLEAPGHDVHRADQHPALLAVEVDERLDVLRIQDVGVGQVARVDVVDDLVARRLHRLVARGDRGVQARIPRH
ncbi:MAG: hypothetical protein AUI15_21765 [Actinobacteria bacterium 13_2_20CM_2_66_6]|nr:MAG: hypothetical protein AUI15_21765 [Actinobacteria bacterium 13_2_20CM_2_66_6]